MPARTCGHVHVHARAQVNPLADTFMLRTLQHVCAQEGLSLSRSDLAGVMGSANGDLRHAIGAVQFAAVGMRRRGGAGARAPGADGGARKSKASASDARSAGAASAAREPLDGGQRDRFPDMFHALGSILHRPAKRQKLAAEALRTVGNKSKGGSAATSVKEQRDTQHSSAQASSSAPSDADGARLLTAGADDGFAPEQVLAVRVSLCGRARPPCHPPATRGMPRRALAAHSPRPPCRPSAIAAPALPTLTVTPRARRARRSKGRRLSPSCTKTTRSTLARSTSSRRPRAA